MQKTSRFHWTLFLLVAVVMGSLAAGIPPARAADGNAADSPVDLFQARADGSLDVKFIPADEKRGMLLLHNRTQQPLLVQIPENMAAVPVLAQLQAEPSPQRIGIGAFAVNKLQVPLRPRTGNAPPPAPADRIVALSPRGKAHVATEGVCLDYGNPTPSRQMHYEVVSLTDLSGDPRLTIALQALGDRRYDQPVVQAVAWHLANGLTWDQLARMEISPNRLRFAPRQLQLAQQLDREVTAAVQPTPERARGASVSQMAVRRRPAI